MMLSMLLSLLPGPQDTVTQLLPPEPGYALGMSCYPDGRPGETVFLVNHPKPEPAQSSWSVHLSHGKMDSVRTIQAALEVKGKFLFCSARYGSKRDDEVREVRNDAEVAIVFHRLYKPLLYNPARDRLIGSAASLRAGGKLPTIEEWSSSLAPFVITGEIDCVGAVIRIRSEDKSLRTRSLLSQAFALTGGGALWSASLSKVDSQEITSMFTSGKLDIGCELIGVDSIDADLTTKIVQAKSLSELQEHAIRLASYISDSVHLRPQPIGYLISSACDAGFASATPQQRDAHNANAWNTRNRLAKELDALLGATSLRPRYPAMSLVVAHAELKKARESLINRPCAANDTNAEFALKNVRSRLPVFEFEAFRSGVDNGRTDQVCFAVRTTNAKFDSCAMFLEPSTDNLDPSLHPLAQSQRKTFGEEYWPALASAQISNISAYSGPVHLDVQSMTLVRQVPDTDSSCFVLGLTLPVYGCRDGTVAWVRLSTEDGESVEFPVTLDFSPSHRFTKRFCFMGSFTIG